MSVALAGWILAIAGAYLGSGLLFALPFLVHGVGRIDAASHGAPLGFRLLILPGVCLLWPYLAWRWLHADRGAPLECTPHTRAARAPR